MTAAPLPSRTYSVTIDRDWRELYEAIWRPEFFAEWAAGMAESRLRDDGDGWQADGPDGPVRIIFTPHNDFGIMDHHVDTGDRIVHVPLRVVENGRGAEVMLTLYRQPGIDDAQFSADAKAINRDLKKLRSVAFRSTAARA